MKNDIFNPLVTFAVLSYNQEKYIEKAIQGALNQDYKNIEFIFSDDCSTDKTSQIISSIIHGQCMAHKVVLNRNPTNLGLAGNFNKIMGLATGDIVVVAAGDDISMPDRVSKTIKMFSMHPGATFVSFTDVKIDEDGEIISKPNCIYSGKFNKLSLDEYLAGCKLSVSGASRAYKKKVFDVFGPLNSSCPTEDTPYLMRCLMLGYGLLSTEVGIYYRQHQSNLSGFNNIYKQNIKYIKWQYFKDLYFADRAKLITKHQKIKIARWIHETSLTRSIINKLFYKEPKYLILIWLIKKYKKISFYTIIKTAILILTFDE